jgi:hypothetical protein
MGTTSMAAAATPSLARHALLIGNDQYTAMSPLSNSANDARDLGAALGRLGFIATVLENQDRDEMQQAIREFSVRLSKAGGIGIFFYAGHAVQVNGDNYLMPVAARVHDTVDLNSEAVQADDVLARMNGAGASLNVMILDACRNNPLPAGFRSASRGLSVMQAPTGSLIAYATAPGSVAADGEGQNGLYTSALLDHIETPGIRLEDVFQRTRATVQRTSGGRQVPWESSSLTRVFRFSDAPESASTTAPPCNPETMNCGQTRAPAQMGDASPECLKGVALACREDANQLLLDGADWQRAAELHRWACTEGDLEGCLEQAQLILDRGDDWKDAVAPLRKACDAEAWRACTQLGKLIMNNEDDWPRARLFFERGCGGGLGDKRACAFMRSR